MKSFKHFMVESVTAQQGFQYELNAAKVLKPFGVVPKGFKPAGAGSDIPDLMIQKQNKKAGCELKISNASAGSLVIKYSNGKWSIGNDNEKNDEKLFIANLAKEVGIVSQLNKQWTNEPYKYATSEEIKSEIAGLGKREVYAKEKVRFKEINGSIPATKIEEYYNKKKTYYVNVGTDGFYLLGTQNPLKIKDIPRFGKAATAKYRARVQSKGGGNYQFTFEMNFSISRGNRSPYNLAPVMGPKDVNINVKNLDLEWYFK